MQFLDNAGEAAASISAILALLGLVFFNPVKRRLKTRKANKEKALKEQKAFRTELRQSLEKITTVLDGLSDDIGDLQYERLSQAQDFYTSRGWCPGAKEGNAVQDARILSGTRAKSFIGTLRKKKSCGLQTSRHKGKKARRYYEENALLGMPADGVGAASGAGHCGRGCYHAGGCRAHRLDGAGGGRDRRDRHSAFRAAGARMGEVRAAGGFRGGI